VQTPGGAHIDLTEGNCNGKDRHITEYIEVVEAGVGDDEAPVREVAAARLIAHDPAFAHVDTVAVADLVARCHAAMNLACRTTPAGLTSSL
jgi:hypothetical protein